MEFLYLLGCGALGFVLVFVPCFLWFMALPQRQPPVYGERADAFADSMQPKYGTEITEDRSDLFRSGIDRRGW
jgi:hypothetical protein